MTLHFVEDAEPLLLRVRVPADAGESEILIGAMSLSSVQDIEEALGGSVIGIDEEAAFEEMAGQWPAHRIELELVYSNGSSPAP